MARDIKGLPRIRKSCIDKHLESSEGGILGLAREVLSLLSASKPATAHKGKMNQEQASFSLAVPGSLVGGRVFFVEEVKYVTGQNFTSAVIFLVSTV